MRTCGRRVAARKGEDLPVEQVEEERKDAAEEKEAASTTALQQLIARVLVDPATTIPLDSANLHRKVSYQLIWGTTSKSQ